MKVLFLDIDGVLLTQRCFVRLRVAGSRRVADPEAVAAVNRIIHETGAQVVVSSTWRIDYDLDELREVLANWGVRGNVIGVTPQLVRRHAGLDVDRPEPRGAEIRAWLSENCVDASDCVILDDADDMLELFERLVRTEEQDGLTMVHAERAIEMLTGEVSGKRGEAWPACYNPVDFDAS